MWSLKKFFDEGAIKKISMEREKQGEAGENLDFSGIINLCTINLFCLLENTTYSN